jgi:hypothetical protein
VPCLLLLLLQPNLTSRHAPRLDGVRRVERIGARPSQVGSRVRPKLEKSPTDSDDGSIPKGGQMLDHLGVLGLTGLTAYFVCASLPQHPTLVIDLCSLGIDRHRSAQGG